jgi:quercetin dioxygenase-like cupin family protein
MNIYKINDMIKGWFVGNIVPAAFTTKDVEVAFKEYKSGEYHPTHYHKIATEITLISSGKVEMNGVQYVKGNIIVISPYDKTDFRVLEDSSTVVVKIPGANNDKYED